jgi:hypothetical protein
VSISCVASLIGGVDVGVADGIAVSNGLHLARAGLAQADALTVVTLVEQRADGVADACQYQCRGTA